MEKRGLVIVIAVLLILSTSVIGNHGDDLSGTPEQNNSKADLDVSTLEDMPDGRIPVKTWAVPAFKRL